MEDFKSETVSNAKNSVRVNNECIDNKLAEAN